MNQIDIQALYNAILNNDIAFYGLIASTSILVIAILLKIFRHDKEKWELDDDELELVDKSIDQVMHQIKDVSGEFERIEEPIVTQMPVETEQATTPDIDKNADTVEILRHISTDSAAEVEYEVRPVGAPEPEEIKVQDKELKKKVVEKPKEVAPEKEKKKPEAKKEPEPVEQPKTLEEGLAKTKGGFIKKLNSLVFGSKQIDSDVLEELEEILYSADIGKTATVLFDKVTEEAKKKDLKDPQKLKALLKKEIANILAVAEQPYEPEGDKPHVILMVGVNGVGKTTTIGKLAKKYVDSGKDVMLAAGDTFRAAAVEQLEIWSKRSKAEFISAKEGANPSGVLYNAASAAKSREADILIADTAGRLHTKFNLMEELRKMKAVISKALDREADEIWLVIDANTGQNAINQAAKFHEALGLTGIILTKLDGTSKGGIVIAITDQLQLPIRFIGIGEGVEDLRPFKAEEFVNALF